MQLVHGEGAVRALACHGAPLCLGANPIPRNPRPDSKPDPNPNPDPKLHTSDRLTSNPHQNPTLALAP